MEAEDPDGKNKKITSTNAIEVAESLCNHSSAMPDEVLLKKELVELSSDARLELDPLEQEVIHRIYIKEQQLMDIAQSLGYSRCHISRVKRKALETLNSAMTHSIHIAIASTEELRDNVLSLSDSFERRAVHRRRPRARQEEAPIQEEGTEEWPKVVGI